MSARITNIGHEVLYDYYRGEASITLLSKFSK